MQAFLREVTYTKEFAMKVLTQIAFPESESVMSRKTFWKMAKAAGTPQGLKEYSPEQAIRLARVANLRRQGYSYKQISYYLKGQIDDGKSNSRQRVQPQSGPEQESVFNFSSFFGGRAASSD